MSYLPFDSGGKFSLGVCICTHNVKDKVLENIQSLIDQETRVAFKILLVDSASTDGTIEAVQNQFPGVSVYRFDDNVGCAIARNYSMELFKNQDVLLLDSDLVLEKEVIENFSKHVGSNTGQVCGHLYSIDGSPQCTAFRKPTLISLAARLFHFDHLLPETLREKYSHENLKGEIKPFWTSGGFTWVTRRAIESVGGRDGDFFVYGEDVEHAHRMQEGGLEIVYTPEARALHYGSLSTRQNMDNCRLDSYWGLKLYWKKRQPLKYPLAFILILLRLFVSSLATPFLRRSNKWIFFTSHIKVMCQLLLGAKWSHE